MDKKLKFSDDDVIGSSYGIYHGNCIDILKKLPEKSANLIFADPPYNLQLKNELYRPNQTKVDGVDDAWDKFSTNEEYDKFTKDWLSACRQVMKKLNGGKQMTSVWQISLCTGNERIKNEQGKKAHSTQKPEELLKRIILSSSSEGDLVLDPFSGSGTTCAVAKKLNRKSVGIEKEVEYIKISKKRLENINQDSFKHLRIIEPKKNTLSRVSMQELLAKKYIKIGQKIWTKNKKHSAIILDDGHIKNGVGAGSIHKIGAIIKESESCNGWMFWCFENQGKLTLIDEHRKDYRKQHGL